jgi:imidazolonepropionase-like amidohydrolase
MANKDSVPPYAFAKLEAMADRQAEAITRAYERGVTIAMGTDIGVSRAGAPTSWGTNGVELTHLVSLGMQPLEAIEAATACGPSTLGAQAPLSGQLRAGYDADVITLSADPVADITVLASPSSVTGVWRGGEQVKAV